MSWLDKVCNKVLRVYPLQGWTPQTHQRRLSILQGNGFGKLQSDKFSLGRRGKVVSGYSLDHRVCHFTGGLEYSPGFIGRFRDIQHYQRRRT